jgi:aminopeptidase N
MTTDPEKNHSYWLGKEQALERGSQLSSISYKLSVILNDSYFSVVCSVQFMSNSESSWLDLNGASIESIIQNNELVGINYLRSRVMLSGLNLGSNLVIISYTREYSKDGYGLHLFKEKTGETYIYSNFEPFHAHKMFPCFDQPDLKATYNLSVKCPSTFIVLSNDICSSIEQCEENQTIHTFQETLKFSTYLFALIAGDYHEHRYEGCKYPMGIYCRKSLADELVPERYLKWTVRGFEYYEQLFDLPYPFRKYDQVFVPEYNAGAMENVGCVTYSESYLKKKQSKTQQNLASFTFLHEMSHMWFGNLVTLKWWDDLWLNESFATYLSYLAADSCLNDEFQGSWLLFLRRKTFAYIADQKKTTHPISSHVENTSQTRTIFDAISYSKGAAVIKQIVFIMGLESFSKSVQDYLSTHAWGNTSYVDFISKLSKRKPELESWAKDWLQTSGVNFLYSKINETGVTLTQTATGTCEKLKTHELLYEVYNENCQIVAQGRCQIVEESLELTLGEKPACIILNIEDQHFIKVIIDEDSLKFIKGNLYRFPSALTRMLVITQLIEMVSSLMLPPAEFLDILFNQFCTETDEILASFILTTASSVLLSKVGEEEVKEEFYPKFFSKILEKIEMSSDFEDNLISFVYTDQQIEQAVLWLQGGSPVMLNQARRWRLLKLYARITVEAKALVDLEADTSHDGRLARLYCESAYPDPEAKSKAWETFMTGCPGLSRFERKSLMSGFIRKSQKKLLKIYSDEYFSVIPAIQSNFGPEYLQDFCSNLFPDFRKLDFLKQQVDSTLSLIGRENKQLVKFFNERLETIEKNRRIKGKI